MEKNAPDHSADAVRYVLTAANQGQHNFRERRMPGGAHPLTWEGRDRGGVYAGGQRVGDSVIGRR